MIMECNLGLKKGERCQYCGSISPEDAIEYLKRPGTRFSGSMWKYGWPHKFYIDVVNPDADKEVEIGSRSGPDVTADTPGAKFHPTCGHEDCKIHGFWETITMGKKPYLHGKFYNNHITQVPDEVFAEFNALSKKIFGIEFTRENNQAGWEAPLGREWSGIIGPDGEAQFTFQSGG